MSADSTPPETVYRPSNGEVHWDRDCHQLATARDERVKERPPSVWPDWVPRCDVCVEPDEKSYQDEDWLVYHYWALRKTAKEMADAADCHPSTITKWMRAHGIPVRTGGEHIAVDDPRLDDPEWIREKYWEDGLSTPEIGDICDVSGDKVCRLMNEYGIEKRSLSERMEVRHARGEG